MGSGSKGSRRIVAVISLSTLLVVSCGGDDDGEAATPTSAAPSSATAGSGTATTPAAGEPIKLGLVTGIDTGSAVNNSEVPDAAEAAAAAINAAGGIGGRPIEIDVCDDHLTADASASCIRDFAEDDNIVAMLGNTIFKDASADVLDEAGFAVIGTGVTKFDYSDDQSILVSGGVIIEFRGAGTVAAEGGKSVAMLRFNLPQADATVEQVIDAIEDAGGSVATIVPVDPTAADMSAPVATALEADPDSVVLGLPEAQIGSGVKALRQAGFEGRIVVPASQLSSESLAALGSDGYGIMGVIDGAPPMAPAASTPGLDRFRAEYTALYPSGRQTKGALDSWLAVQLFAEVVDGLTTVDRASVLTGVRAVTNWETGGVLPPIDLSQPGPLDGFPNVASTVVSVLTSVDGVWTWDGEFVEAL